ncbi:hypothetical protein AN957_09660 [Cytobacillus solani]|uniref:Uncharacterized protein n=1 Tax=Cytobacillus solani TaxID=1637975 RepID=A0A0Q3VGI8_9BACI|nr:hypothetical protein AN957_09660 [Cytobacillus solani]
MNLVEAIRALTTGDTAIVSVIGRRYTIAELAPKMIGENACVYNNVGMTEAERKGEWRVV